MLRIPHCLDNRLIDGGCSDNNLWIFIRQSIGLLGQMISPFASSRLRSQGHYNHNTLFFIKQKYLIWRVIINNQNLCYSHLKRYNIKIAPIWVPVFIEYGFETRKFSYCVFLLKQLFTYFVHVFHKKYHRWEKDFEWHCSSKLAHCISQEWSKSLCRFLTELSVI
jgi:hypothetical protein